MIASLSLSNFKCFQSLILDFGKISVLAGENGSGKSSVIQALLLLRQSVEANSLPEKRLLLNGELVELGTAGEVFCAAPLSDTVTIGLFDGIRHTKFICPQRGDRSGEYFLQFSNDPFDGASPLSLPRSLRSEPFNYLHAERIGARKIFQISTSGGRFLRVGKYGENAPYIAVSEQRGEKLDGTARILASSDDKEYPTIQFQWQLWMARIFPGFAGETELYANSDQIRLGISMQRRETGQGIYVRPTNTGFGLSYVLGIVVAGLAAKPGTLLIVENPEAHLHPRAQSIVGEFLARVAADGVQVVVETHSEHVVNGVRRMVKQGILEHHDSWFYFFGRKEHSSFPVVTKIGVTESADLAPWPDGFFDQLDKDLGKIFA